MLSEHERILVRVIRWLNTEIGRTHSDTTRVAWLARQMAALAEQLARERRQ